MCNKPVHENPWFLKYVPDQYKTEDNKAVDWRLYLLQHVPDWFVTQQVKPWHNDKLIEWYEDYKKRKAQKDSIKEELMPIAWHPSRWRDWCVPEDEKKETKKLWGSKA